MDTTTTPEALAAAQDATGTKGGRPPPAGPPPGRHLLITKAEMLRKVGRRWSTVWAWIAAGKFPQPVCPDPDTGAVMWILAEVDAWIEGLMATQRKAYPSGDSSVGNAKHAKKEAANDGAGAKTPARAKRRRVRS